jgi:type IV pilus assembly protein PilA
MQVWYYHSPGQGKIGPLSVAEIQQHYRERRMNLETLVWREGMREWQPAERLIDELQLIGIVPDAAQPPPVPQGLSLSIAEIEDERFGDRDHAQTQTDSKPKSGCLIVAIVVGAVGLILLSILAAIAIPAYKDYAERAKRAQQVTTSPSATPLPTVGPPAAETAYDARTLADDDARVRRVLTDAMGAMRGGQCPQEFEFETVQIKAPELTGQYEISLFSEDRYRCAYSVRLGPVGSAWANVSTLYVVQGERGNIEVSCRSNAIDPQLKPPNCN